MEAIVHKTSFFHITRVIRHSNVMIFDFLGCWRKERSTRALAVEFTVNVMHWFCEEVLTHYLRFMRRDKCGGIKNPKKERKGLKLLPLMHKPWSWRIQVSIPVLPACKAGALPIELIPRIITDFGKSWVKLLWLSRFRDLHDPQCGM